MLVNQLYQLNFNSEKQAGYAGKRAKAAQNQHKLAWASMV